MKRLAISLSIFCVAAIAAIAGVFPARTVIELAKLRHNAAIKSPGASQHPPLLQAFVTVDSPIVLDQLSTLGATVNARFGNTATITFELSSVGSIAQVHGIKSLEVARHLELCNAKARELSYFPSMSYNFNGYTSPVNTGSGVVVGMIDVGFDFNHINFIDHYGKNRIVRVYLPEDSTGTAPIIDSEMLPGSEYATPEQISALTTDDSSMAHGTHTTGTAAGGYLDNGLHGVATGAMIVACGMPANALTDVNIANSIKYIFDYADKMELPAVINMSIGDQVGAHDGTSTLCRLFNEVTGPGRVCVVSAGNDADMPMNIRKKLGEGDSLATFLANWYSREPMIGYSSMWSQSPARHTVDIVIWDVKADTLVHRLDVPRDAALDSVYMVSSENDPVFAQHFEGELYFACALEDNGKFHSLIETNYKSLDRSRYRIGIINRAPAGETLMGWCGGQVIYSKSGLTGWSTGLRGNGCSVSDLATADSVISVGAYCSTNSFVMMDGSTVSYDDCHPYDIAEFSGFGPDARNKQRPDLVAPGYAMASSVSRWAETYHNPANIVDKVTIGGIDYPYGLEGGTSMSTPMVAGAIALWLEIDPSLSPAHVREIMAATCYSDEYTTSGTAKKWGYGKLDIDAGIKYLIAKLHGDVDGDGAVTAADVSCLYDIMLGNSIRHIECADINGDNSINSTDISLLYTILLSQ